MYLAVKQESSFDHPHWRPNPRQFVGRIVRPLTILFVLAIVAVWQYYRNPLGYRRTDRLVFESLTDNVTFKWEQIVPTKHLVYHPCYEEYQCARLELPMDWNRTDGQGSKIALAIMKLPAKVSVVDARYGGPVILNPGGPGGSGVNFLLQRGKSIQTIVNFEHEPSTVNPVLESTGTKYFDIVSFDPRGINHTTPAFSCFEHPGARRAWELQVDAEGILGSSEGASNTMWARSKALGMSCSQPESHDREWIGHFMNTAPVVADMAELIERHGEWREKETDRLLANQKSGSDEIRLRSSWKKGEERLLYWGFSYGSVLGTTFAAMLPGRIHRAVIDGVCDVPDYYAGGWLTNLQDSDSAFEKFCDYCHEAGPTACPFAMGDMEKTQARFEELLIDIKTNPVPVPGSRTQAPDIITYSNVRSMVFDMLYSPMKAFPRMAQLLTDLTQRNGSSFADYKYESRGGNYSSSCPADDQGTIPRDNDHEAMSSILCTDGTDISAITKDEYRQYWRTLQEQSHIIGDLWANIRLPCVGWKARPAWHFDGPFAGNTSHPLLFIGNSHDPVTPLRNAFAMSQGFPNSMVLQQNSVGHCSISAPSLCTAKAVRQYFQTGELPQPGTICEVDERPFQLAGPQKKSQLLSPAEQRLMEVLSNMPTQRMVTFPGLG